MIPLLSFLLDSDIVHYRPGPSLSDSPLYKSILLSLVFAPGLIWTIRYLYKQRHDRLWKKGIFPQQLEFGRETLLEAYICLAARMLQRDIQDLPKKISFLQDYFAQHFPGKPYQIRDSISFSLQHPIQLSTVATWIKLNLPQKKDRLQILYFLSGLAMVDGLMLPGEERLLKEIGEALELSPGEINGVLAMHRRYQEEQQRQRSERQAKPRQSDLELCAEILGVSLQAGIDEIKKAYRKLAKLHHPDRFVNEGAEQQAIAQTRFVQIQKAYEILLASR